MDSSEPEIYERVAKSVSKSIDLMNNGQKLRKLSSDRIEDISAETHLLVIVKTRNECIKLRAERVENLRTNN